MVIERVIEVTNIKNNKLALGLLISLLCLTIIGVSYAVWRISLVQTGSNKIVTSCFDVAFKEDSEAINLENVYPILDEEGIKGTPYTFTLTNNCAELASYQINLEVLNTTTLNSQYIKVYLDSGSPSVLTNLNATSTTLDEAKEAYVLDAGYFEPNESKTFNLRIWMDEDTPALEETMNKTFASKVTVTTSYLKTKPSDYEICVSKYGEDSIQCSILASVDTTGKCAEVEEGGTVNLNKNYENEEVNEGNMQTIMADLIESEEGYVCSAPDDYGNSYYYRGAVENNWVKFADSYWRIIRVNGDGSIRLLYNGEASVIDALDPEVKAQVLANGYDDSSTNYTIIGESRFNSSYDDNAYVGYMYGTPGSSNYTDTHANTNDSTIKEYIDNWYESKFLNTEYESYLSDTLFCSDRSLLQEESFELSGEGTFTQLGYGKEITAYRGMGDYGFFMAASVEPSAADYNQLSINPTLQCKQKNDRFTVNDEKVGNGALTYPVSLITVDEIYLAGGSTMFPNNGYYLYNGDYYWALSPDSFDDSGAYVRSVGVGGSTDSYDVYSSHRARPVLNLKAGSLKMGSGTATDPYTVE